MAIALATYGYVDRNAGPPTLQMEELDTELERFMEDHLDQVVRRYATPTTGTTSFTSDAAREGFAALWAGSEREFLSAAQAMVNSVHSEMVKKANPNPGFVVGLRATPSGAHRTITTAAILKLDVVDRTAAQSVIMAGRRTLRGMKDLVEQPGDLQKGALVPDPREDSDVVVGERAQEVALYFLDGLGVSQVMAGGKAVSALLAKARGVAPRTVPALAEKMEALAGPSGIDEFLADAIPEEAERLKVIAAVASSPRRIVTINPAAHRIMGEIVAGDVRIQGPRSVIAAARIARNRRGGWTVSVDVPEEPVRDYK